MTTRTNPYHITRIALAVLALIISVYFALSSTHNRELTVTYFAKRALVTMAGSNSMDLQVTLNGTRVESPWLVSARLENTGNEPIDKVSIEEPLRLSFSGGKVLSARIVQRSQDKLFGEAARDGNDVVIRHNLLNDGDWLAFDIIFDGEPNMLPDAFARISGVTRVKQVPIQSDDRRKTLSLFPLPPPFVSLLLIVCTFAAGISVILGCVLIVRELTRFMAAAQARAARAVSPEANDMATPPSELTSTPPTTAGGTARQILQALGGSISNALVDNPDLLRKRIREKNLVNLLNTLNLDVDSAAAMLSIEVKQSLRDSIATKLCAHMAADLRLATCATIQAIEVRNISTLQLYTHAGEIAAKASASALAAPELDRDDIMFGTLFFATGIALLLILGGTWRVLLS